MSRKYATSTTFVAAAFPVRHHYQRQVLAGLAREASSRRDWQLLHMPELADGRGLPGRAWRPDAVVCSGHGTLAARCARDHIPVVTIDHHPIDGIPCVLPDEASVGRLAVAHLVERGYNRIALLAPTDDEQLDRQHAMHAAATALKLPISRLQTPWPGRGGSLLAAIDQLGRRLARLPGPLGLCCLNDALAWSAIAASRRCGLAVPSDLGILGADDDPLAVLAGPIPVSSVAIPHAEVGRRAATVLAILLAGGRAAAVTRVPASEVVARGSTDLQRAPDAQLAAALGWIATHALDNASVDQVAAAVGLSRRTLERRFREHLGSSVLQEMLRVRTAAARRMLRDGHGIPATAAALNLSLSAFRDAFLSETGQTPGAYRDTLRGA